MSDKEYLTPSELEIEARAKAATPGPWEPEKSEPTTKEEMKRYAAKCINAGNNTQYALVMYHGNGGWDICHTGNGESSIANAEFIAHSRADIPALLSTLRAERAKRAGVEEKYNEVMGAVGIFAVTHDEKALQKLCALADDWLNESEAPAPDPHTPGPGGPQGGC